MNKLSTNNEKGVVMGNGFSFSNGFRFLLKMNFLMMIAIGIFLINRASWGFEGHGDIYVFILFAEPTIFLFSLFACFQQRMDRSKDRKLENNEWIGLLVALGFSILFFMICFSTVAPFPSNFIFGILATNILVAFYSIIFPRVTIYIYEANVNREHETVTSYIFKYIAILFSGLTYQVLVVLQRLPFLFNRLFGILFTVVIILLLFSTGRLFE